MVKVGYDENETFELTSLGDFWGERRKKVGCHKRKSRDKEYKSPRITLPSSYERYIGQTFRVFEGRANYLPYKDADLQEGKCLVLFFPNHLNKKEDSEE